MKIFKIDKQGSKMKVYLFGHKILSCKYKILNPFKKPIFRNDDVSVDTHLEHFMDFCEIFHKHKFTQIHAITIYGYTNCLYFANETPLIYDGYDDIGKLDYETIKQLSQGKFIGDNKELCAYINQIPDEIALHGLYHTDYSKMSYEEQKEDIKEGLRLLKELFPNKKVKYFVAPFNRTNKSTYKVCKELNLQVSAQEGEHLEDMIAHRRYGIKNGELYRYHHHRFYPESTFHYYDLNLAKLDSFLAYKPHQKRKLPDKELFAQIVKKHNAQEWFIYAYNDFTQRAHAYLPYKWIKENVKTNKSILATGCGAGDMLYMLYMLYYDDLSAYDYDKKAISAAKEIAESICAPINFFVEDGRNPKLHQNYDVIVGINWIYHCPDYGLYDFLRVHISHLSTDGVFVFDTIDASYNDIENNQFCTQDWDKPLQQRRPSEYLYRYSKDDVKKLAEKYDLDIVYYKHIEGVVPHSVYVLKKKKMPKICLLCDRPNWAFDISAKEIVNQLSDEFCFDIKYVVDKPKLNPKDYDLIHICFWGETYHQKFKFPKSKVLKEISSWRWFDNAMYGPCTPKEMADKYLFDADYVFCVSKGLYDEFKNVKENIFLTENGFSPLKFYYQKERKGEKMSICWAGNIKDPVKNIENILIPATKDKFKLHLASDLAHHQMADFYNNSDIYVVCSKNEGEPLPLMESMACGCFPVANRVGFCAELIRHKENGYLVSQTTIKAYQEAFEWCKENLFFIREQGRKNAKEMFETRRWEIMAQGYRIMYRQCLERSKNEIVSKKTKQGYDREVVIFGFMKIKYKSKNFAGNATHKTCKVNISKQVVLSVIKFSKDILKNIDLNLLNRHIKHRLDVNSFMKRVNLCFAYFDNISPKSKIIEIGSGMGISCICAKALTNANIIGVEPAPKSYKELHDCIRSFKEANPNLEYEILNCGGESVPLDDESIDFIYSFEVLEHVQEPYKVLSEIHRLLKKGGKAYISTCNYDSFYEGHYKRFWNPFISPEGNKRNFVKKGLSPHFFDELNFITKKKIIKYVNDIGFSKCEFDPILSNPVNNINLEVIMSDETKSLISKENKADNAMGGGNPTRLHKFIESPKVHRFLKKFNREYKLYFLLEK